MTNVKHISIETFGQLQHSIGLKSIMNEFDQLFSLNKHVLQHYPPHNIIKVNDYKYIVQFALAGFTKDEIELTVEDGKLIVKGNKKEPAANFEYLHKGIGTRAFTKSIPLIDTIEIENAVYQDGILHIELLNKIPEHKKPKKIEINSTLEVEEKDTKKLLVE